MPEKKTGNQAALLVAGGVLLAVILVFVFGSRPGGDDSGRPDVPTAEKQASPILDELSTKKKRVEAKLRQALSPKAPPRENPSFYQPPQTRPGPDSGGRIPRVTAAAEGDPLEIIQQFTQSAEPEAPRNRGWTGPDFVEPILLSRTRSRHNGVTHLYLRQTVDGVEVYNGNLNANVAGDGSILSLNNGFIKNVSAQINRRQPQLTAAEAIEKAAEQVKAGVAVEAESLKLSRNPEGPAQSAEFDGGDLSFDPIPAKLVYVAQPGNQTRLAWNLVLHLKDGVRWLDLTIDAVSGKLLTQANWYAEAGYQVYAPPKEHPNDGGRTLETDPEDLASSPFGWHDTDGAAGAEFNTTQGNNVFAQEDTNADNGGGRRPNGGAGLDFVNPINLAQAPPTYEDAAITNLFFWNNYIHDVLWHYGFDEASGNFQENNYGNGGTGGDPVQADAQDGSGTDNANFGTPPDGQDPRMQMFVWTYTTPDRDSDLDNGVIIHEYGHGISNRLTGGAANSSALTQSQAIGMGEGWSDWWALCLTAVPGDTATTPRGIGTYVLGEPIEGDGIRPYRYSTDLVENPMTYGLLDDGGLSVPHGIGTVWCTTLWEVYWALVGVYGWDPDFSNGTGGNNIAMQLVIDGMKMQPVNPTYLDARDAIILADQVNNSGANADLLWQAFAKRGMGFSATDGGSASSLNVSEAFDVPDEAISITDVSVFEGDSGTVAAVFTVSLDQASPDEEIRVSYASENETAIAPGDFAAVSDQLIFPAGTTTQTVTVQLNGDPDIEEDETFIIRLSGPINARITDDEGIGTILNDEYIPPVITSSLTEMGTEGTPFNYTIEAIHAPRTFTISGEPSGMSADPVTGIISWLSPVIGTYTIGMTAINPAGSDTKTLSVEIVENPLLTALDIPGLPITTSAAPWFSQTTETHDGVDAAQSGDVNDDESSWMEFETTGPDTAYFWWKVSSESFYDYLIVSIDGAVQRAISGEVDWQRIELDIPAGNHTIRWEYLKDFSVSDGADAGWVDELVLLSLDPRPIITSELTVIGEKDQAFSFQIETTKPATSFSSDPLPPGLSLNSSTGLISGTPTVAGTNDVTITATNASGSDSQLLRLVITEIATFPFFDDFESGILGPNWTPTGTNQFRIEVTQANGPAQSGLWHLIMDDSEDGAAYSRNETTLTIDLAGRQDVVLAFWAKAFSDEPDGPPSSPFTTGADFDGVAISEDGVTWYEVQGLRSEVTDEWEQFQVDLDDSIAAHGLSYTSAFRIRFNQYDNFSAPVDGIAIDDVIVGKKTESPDLTPGSDSGVSDTDDITNDATPTFSATGTPGTIVTLTSDIDGDIGIGTVNGAGDWMIISTNLTEGIHEITATAEAAVPSLPLEVIIDVTGATVFLNQAAGQENPTSVPTVNFSISFDEPAQSFGEGDVTLGGSLAPTATKTVSESLPNDGTTFNLQVSGLTEDGTITAIVPAGVTTDLAGNPSEASTSTYSVIFYRILAPPPDSVTASDGLFTDKIQLTWDLVPNADGGSVIYRSTVDDFSSAAQLVATLGGVTVFNDTLTVSGNTYFYWVKSRRQNAGLGAESASDSGFRAEDENGNSSGSATDLGLSGSGSSSASGILEPNDSDFFKFELEWKAHVEIYTTGSLDTEGTLFEFDGVTLINDPAADGDAAPDGRNFKIEQLLEPGTYFVKVAGAGNNQSGPYDLVFEIEGPLNFRPDYLIGASPTGLLGNGVYNTSGSGQSLAMISKKLRSVTIHGRVENDGNFADVLTLSGSPGSRLFAVNYFDPSGNVTAAMVSGTLTGKYEAGEGKATQILIKPSKKLKKKRRGKKPKFKKRQYTSMIRVTSGTETDKSDAVITTTKTKK